MDIRCFMFVGILFFYNFTMSQIYFWESYRDGGRSCCLFMSGVDICNPYVACTRHVATDLMGIENYISRILLVDKGQCFSYHKTLIHAQNFIKQSFISPINLYYRYDEPQRHMKFFHEIQESTRANEKTGKASASSSSSEKQKAEDAVTAYLIKIGIARPLK